MTDWAFERGEVAGRSFAEIFADALHSVATQLQSGQPLIDPVLERDYKPEPDAQDRAEAGAASPPGGEGPARPSTPTTSARPAALWCETSEKNKKESASSWFPTVATSTGASCPVASACRRSADEGA